MLKEIGRQPPLKLKSEIKQRHGLPGSGPPVRRRPPARPPLALPPAAMPLLDIVFYFPWVPCIFVYVCTDFNLSEDCFPIFLRIFYQFIQFLHGF